MMRSKFLFAACLATVIAATTGVPVALAKGKAKSQSSEAMPDNIKQQFQWEEKVVGPNDKKIDHEKIARMQAAARKQDENRKNEPAVKKPERAKGVAAPSTATLPTMDIEKPAASAPKAAPRPKATATAEKERPRDSLDNLLDSEKAGPSAKSGGGGNGLDKLLAVDDKGSHGKAKSAKRTRRGRP